ncbi:unnamed protein product [Cylicocyclus nassatus]|uniref:Uncharacterized protein n=1 Tax=Cylicocyclus nassatus TaxID=53992 RepID=A0AA36GGL0_CYLNA|nr:unnamed protein product [Cylicocyclus nassatus]
MHSLTRSSSRINFDWLRFFRAKRLCEVLAALVTAAEVFSYAFLPPAIQWSFMLASVALFMMVCATVRSFYRVNPYALIAGTWLLKLPVVVAIVKIIYTIVSYNELERPIHWNDYVCLRHFGSYQCSLYGRSLVFLWAGLVVSILCLVIDVPLIICLLQLKWGSPRNRGNQPPPCAFPPPYTISVVRSNPYAEGATNPNNRSRESQPPPPYTP